MITTKARRCVTQPFIMPYYGTGVPHSVNVPLHTITAKPRFGLVEGYYLDIHFRMLQPHELSAAMGFPPGYQFTGTKEDQVRQIGNAVEVNKARALIRSMLQTL